MTYKTFDTIKNKVEQNGHKTSSQLQFYISKCKIEWEIFVSILLFGIVWAVDCENEKSAPTLIIIAVRFLSDFNRGIMGNCVLLK